MQKLLDDQHKDMKLQIQGLVPPGQQLHRNVLFDQLYASIPKDPEAKVQIYTAELAPKGWTNFHCHNGATFFLALQGVFEAHFEEGILIRAKAGDVYSEPIGKMHRGHNPHETLPYLCVAFCVTAPDRDHVTNVIKAFLLRPASPFVRAWRPHTAARWLRRARLPAALSRARGLCLTNAGFFCTSISSGSSAGLGVSLQR
jgi:quercetin dioxygenase-like cupin family protein